MKCISIRQPWAYAIIYCGKNIENRSWSTSYRGPLLIHASLNQKKLDQDLKYIEKKFNCVIPKDKLEFGKIIGAVKLNNVFCLMIKIF